MNVATKVIAALVVLPLCTALLLAERAPSADFQSAWDATLATASKEGKVAGCQTTGCRSPNGAGAEARYAITMEYLSSRIDTTDASVAGNQTFTGIASEKMPVEVRQHMKARLRLMALPTFHMS